MSIVRAPRPESGWYALDKRISEDERLSWAARGLLVFLLGKPDHWKVSVEHLRKQTERARVRTGRDGIYALLGELQSAGYITARQERRPDGTLGPIEYQVREAAAPLPAEPDTARPLPAGPYTAEPTLAKTDSPARNEGDQGKTATRKRAAPVVALPEWLDPEAWAAFVDHRRKIKAPMTDRAAELAVAELGKLRAAGHDPRAVIHQSILNGWRGLFAPKDSNDRAPAHRNARRESEAERVERINREHDDRERAAGGLL